MTTTTTTTAPAGLTACRDHRSAAGVTLVIETPEQAAQLAARAGLSAPLRASWAASLSMGRTPFCCPASAHARELMAAAFRALPAPEAEGEFPPVGSVILTGCHWHGGGNAIGTPAKAAAWVARLRRDMPGMAEDMAHELSMGHQVAGEPCCPAAAYARHLLAAEFRAAPEEGEEDGAPLTIGGCDEWAANH